MTVGFRMSGGPLESHVTEVEAVSERIRRAADSAVPLRRDAYGLVGQGFAGLADAASRSSAAGVAALAEHLQGIAAGLRQMRAEYDAVEQQIAASLRGPR